MARSGGVLAMNVACGFAHVNECTLALAVVAICGAGDTLHHTL